mgnify:CR=1 FL=1
MNKREKVIKGLEESYQAYLVVEGRGILVDSNENEYALIAPALMRDALALLKAQEPRVMTPTEIAALKVNDIVWYEQHGTYGDFLAAMVADGGEFIGNTSMSVRLRYLDKSERLWTSRPTDKQREAIPWNAQK